MRRLTHTKVCRYLASNSGIQAYFHRIAEHISVSGKGETIISQHFVVPQCLPKEKENLTKLLESNFGSTYNANIASLNLLLDSITIPNLSAECTFEKNSFSKYHDDATKCGSLVISEYFGEKATTHAYKFKLRLIPGAVETFLKKQNSTHTQKVWYEQHILPLPSLELFEAIKNGEEEYDPFMSDEWFKKEVIWTK